MKLVVLGANGQVGHKLQTSLLPLGEVIALDRSTADLTKLDEVKEALLNLKPDVIVNAAAYTAVDKAEEDQDLAMLVNGKAPGVIAEVAKQLGALFIHYSTDFVFDGAKREPYNESDEPNPINVYGQSKLAGERAVQKAGGNYLIFRTAWVYSLHGHNFLKTILRLAQEKEELGIVDDQFGVPTWAGTIAGVTAECIPIALDKVKNEQFSSGLYHLTAKGETSWYGFTREIVKLANKDTRWTIKVKNINPIPTESYPLPAMRPKYSVLSTEKLKTFYDGNLPEWNEALQACLVEK